MLQDTVSTENKEVWCRHGESLEQEFIDTRASKCVPHIITLNPAKKQDKYAPDLLFDGKLADLKTQNTPFFKAEQFYGVPPKWAVTFNVKDYNRYTQRYPGIEIVYWVKWKQTEWLDPKTQNTYKVEAFEGIWLTSAKQICQFVENGAPKHDYMKRRDDNHGNARDSFCFDLRQMTQVWLKERRLYTINFDDGTNLSVVDENPGEGEIDNEIIDAVKTIKQTLRAEIIGSEQAIL